MAQHTTTPSTLFQKVNKWVAEFVTPSAHKNWRWNLKNCFLRKAGLTLGKGVVIDQGFYWFLIGGGVVFEDHVAIGKDVSPLSIWLVISDNSKQEHVMSRDNKKTQKTDFEKLSKQKRTSLPAEFWFFLKHNKKWWLIPVLVILLLLCFLVILGGSSIAPFLYPLF